MARSRTLSRTFSLLLALAAPLALAWSAGCASDIGLTGVGDAVVDEEPENQDAAQQGGQPPQDGEQPPADGEGPPDDGEDPPGDGEGPPDDGEGPPDDGEGPAPCDLDQDCDAACPPGAIGCVCAVDPQGMTMCVPECEVDSDCPAPPDMTLVCDSIEEICVPEGM